MTSPTLYVALGDSMSIDLYPRLELQERGRVVGAAAPGVGAASLFHRNHDPLWPEFARRDLAGRFPDIQKLDLCVDGATIGHTLTHQLPLAEPRVREAARVVTVTAGGNDLLGALFDGAGLASATRAAVSRYEELVGRVVAGFPRATVLLTTVYDPTDGTGVLPGLSEQFGPLPMEHLAVFNDAVRTVAGAHDRTLFAPVHDHFLGHGLTAPAGERWYWETSPIEPGATGASEIRRVWLDALGM